ncbi:DUF664 domain-containing protein [Streptomyces sp. NPDC053513]|uniref:mycothiol transferase n=1 Tax=unclassified Streptomyces TaxID=2593676 RepID=UPI0037CF5FF4
MNTHGLTDEQARMTASVGESGIGGPIRHAARCETFWTGLVLPQRSRPQRKAAEARPDPWFRPWEPGRRTPADDGTDGRATRRGRRDTRSEPLTPPGVHP